MQKLPMSQLHIFGPHYPKGLAPSNLFYTVHQVRRLHTNNLQRFRKARPNVELQIYQHRLGRTNPGAGQRRHYTLELLQDSCCVFKTEYIQIVATN